MRLSDCEFNATQRVPIISCIIRCRSFDSSDSPIAFEIFDDGLGTPISYGIVEKAISDVLSSHRLGGYHLAVFSLISMLTRRSLSEIIFPSCGATLSIQVEMHPELTPFQTLTEVVKALDKLMKIPESTQVCSTTIATNSLL